jgi:NADPH-dependent 2,4-dienoyl-CoA reductase/sulfur reductase-like enzyme
VRNRQLTAATADGGEAHIRYDTLIIATGAEPIRPCVPGIDRDGVFQLHTVDDSLVLNEALGRGPSSAVIVGAGYIGLEMAEALRARGVEVTIIEQLSTVLPTVDPPLGSLVREELEANGVQVITQATVTSIDEGEGRLAVVADPDLIVDADIVLVVVGVRPDAKLGREAGAETGEKGALQVNRRMETISPASTPPATVSSPFTVCSTPTATCRSARQRTSKAVSQVRTPWAASEPSRAHSERRWSRSSSSRSPAPACATRKQRPPGSSR